MEMKDLGLLLDCSLCDYINTLGFQTTMMLAPCTLLQHNHRKSQSQCDVHPDQI